MRDENAKRNRPIVYVKAIKAIGVKDDKIIIDHIMANTGNAPAVLDQKECDVLLNGQKDLIAEYVTQTMTIFNGEERYSEIIFNKSKVVREDKTFDLHIEFKYSELNYTKTYSCKEDFVILANQDGDNFKITDVYVKGCYVD